MARPRTHDDELKERLLTKCRTKLKGNGLENINLRSLAKSCDTSTAAVYALFGGKPELIRDVLALELDDFQSKQASCDYGNDPVEGIVTYAKNYRTWALENSHIYRALFSSQELPEDMVAVLLKNSRVVLSDLLQAAVDAGVTSYTPEELLDAVTIPIHGAIALETSGAADIDDGLFARVIHAAITN